MKGVHVVILSIAMFCMGILAGAGAAFNDASCKRQLVLEIPGTGYHVELPEKLTPRQSTVLAVAYKVAKDDGIQYPQVLQGILLQETQAGALPVYKVAGQEYGLNTNQRYYGVGQIKLSAARDVLKRWPDLWQRFRFQTQTDEEIIAKLIENDLFNVMIASKYLVILTGYGYHSPTALSVAYNRGAGGAALVNHRDDPYAIGVLRHIREIDRV